jgi:hypothetical protein
MLDDANFQNLSPLLDVFSAEQLSGPKPEGNPWRDIPQLARPRQLPMPIWDHAAPIDPLRERDLKELYGWFERTDMTDVEDDIAHRLRLLPPEPFWDDPDWRFLREFLA